MKQFLILICIALISACQPLAVNSYTLTPSEISNLRSGTPTKIKVTQVPFSTNTRTFVPSDIPFPEDTPTPFPPKSFDPAVIQTFTLSAPSRCPEENPSLQFDVEKVYFGRSSNSSNLNEEFTNSVLNFLNSGGTPKSILPAFEKYYAEPINPFLKIQDVTGDNVPELIFPYGIWLNVFGCQDGQYELLFTDFYESGNDVDIVEISDINLDGLAEAIVYFSGCWSSRCPIIRVYEWNGKGFEDLIANPNQLDSCSHLSIAPFEVKIRDIDKNGTKEVILSNHGNPWPDNDFPYRKETRICMWNGQNIVLYKSEFDAPYYRFQAVQDGDRATLAADYDRGLVFYQKTINDKHLQWFTQDRKWYDFSIYQSKYFPSFQEPTPTISPSLVQDPNEYSVLAAYAYYRIMLIDILQNDMAKAESTFNMLQNEFPAGTSGDYFAQVATIFRQEYQLSTNVGNSCGKVIQYAQNHPLPIQYLGDWDHGVHSILYIPESICPFR